MKLLRVTGVLFLAASMATTAYSAERMREGATLDQDTLNAALLKHRKEITSYGSDLKVAPVRNADLGNGRIVNGLSTVRFPAVGAVVHRTPGAHGAEVCTGTLIRCDKVLTAAHCIAGDSNHSNYSVYFQHAGVVKVRHIDWLKQRYVPAVTADFAILTTDKQITGIVPAKLNALSTPLTGTRGIIVGYGSTGGDDLSVGLKRLGYVKTSQCPTNYQGKDLIC